MGGHHSRVPTTVEWLTSPATIEKLGGWQANDRDPCAPIEQPYPTARETWTIVDDGLKKRWDPKESFWLNPPYTDGVVELWLSMLADHGNGIAMIFARTDTEAFHRFGWQRAHAMLFQRGRENFHYGEAVTHLVWRKGRPTPGRTFMPGDRAPKNSGAPTVFIAYGERQAERLADCGIEGRFVPLIFGRSVMALLFDATNVKEESYVTWRDVVVEAMKSHGDSIVSVEAVWRIVREQPKAAGREHARAKVRQILQQVGERVERGQYRLAV